MRLRSGKRRDDTSRARTSAPWGESGNSLRSEAGLIEKSGAYSAWKGERIAQGRDRACQYLSEHPELSDELREKLVTLRKAENSRLGAAPPPAGASATA